ncbi:MAG: hypothetical protein IH614_14045 [Desulfuromonadales bacterium]|nr:hypothetical protein [Desulfuromonadales bacterium]
MKSLCKIVAALVLATSLGGTALAGDVSINVNLGHPVPIIVPEPPLFLVPPTLGFRVAVDVPYDLVYIDGRYYSYRDRSWHVGPNYHGPWTVVRDRLPYGLRKYKVSQIRDHREKEYRHYQKDKHRYKGESYRPHRDGDDHPGKNKGHKKGKHD